MTVARRNPIRVAFRTVGARIGSIGTLATAAVGWGLLTAQQGDAITGLLGAIPAVITAATAVWTAFSVRRRAEPETTPTADPLMEGDDGELVRLVPAAGRHRRDDD